MKWVCGREKLVELTPEAKDALKAGRLKAPAATKLAKLSAEEQKKAVSAPGKVKVPAKQSDKPAKPTARQFREVISTWATDTTINESVRYFAEQVEKYLNGEIKEIKLPAKLSK